MQHSKSLGFFGSSSGDSDTNAQLGPDRPRKRSSLDTFVIPGRIRIPSQSQHIDSFDEVIAQSLLRSSMAHMRDDSIFRLEKQPQPPPNHQHLRNFLPSTGSAGLAHDREQAYINQQLHYRIQGRPRTQTRGPEYMHVPRRRPRRYVIPSNGWNDRNGSPHSSTNRARFDGARDSSHESRATSTTWSTVSISRRVVSDVPGATREELSAKFNDQYNDLATAHGLPKLCLPPTGNLRDPSLSDGTDVHKDTVPKETEVKSTSKEHKHNWLTRKLLPRNSATVTYKARTTYRPLPQKKSLSRVASFTDGGRKKILDGKSLEDTCRLGGLGILELPDRYAVEKLTMPTCLSAAAGYLLHHGVNAPGLFRVSGQATIINALYDYYAHQFLHAGSPSKVQTTIHPGQLPLHIEHTLPDVASFFKKILNTLPGGLLGTRELFEAFRIIFLDLGHDLRQTEGEDMALKAKLVALAILSTRSEYRFNLIQGVLGLISYLGNEAEVTCEALRSTENATPGQKKSPELMGFHSLGVCLGPLLIADLVDSIDTSEVIADNDRRASIEISEKTGRKRLSFVANKLERTIDLAASVERANLAATIMQSLLVIWPEVVKQLWMISATAKFTATANKGDRVKQMGGNSSSENFSEEVFLSKLQEGAPFAINLDPDYIKTRKVRARVRSSTSRLRIQPSDEGLLKTYLPSETEENPSTPKRAVYVIRDIQDESQSIPHPFRQLSLNDHLISEGESEPETSMPPVAKQIGHNDFMERMSMGQILPPRNGLGRDLPETSKCHRRHDTDLGTPRQTDSRRTSVATQEKALRDLSQSDYNFASDFRHLVPLYDKPLPPLKDESPPPPPPAVSQKLRSYPARESSLAHDDMGTQIQRNESKNATNLIDMAAETAKPTFVSKPERLMSVPMEIPNKETTSGKASESSGEATVLGINSRALKHVLDKPLPTPVSTSDDPFTRIPPRESTRDSLIPKPINDLGHCRQASSRTPSPPKPSGSPKRQSAISISSDKDLESVRPEVAILPPTPKSSAPLQRAVAPKNNMDCAPTRDLSAYTRDSLQRMKLVLEEPPTAQFVRRRPLSFERSRSESPSRLSNATHESSGSLVCLVKRSGSAHATLYAEAMHLRRQLDQKNEELQATKRSLEAAIETREEQGDDATPKRASWNKGTLSAEVRDLTRERDIWKKRAEWAEKRLQGLSSLAQAVASEGGKSSSQELF